MQKMVRVQVYISGMVQGVFFRASMRNKARDLGIYGFVRNLRDGRVHAILEGEESSVLNLLEWCNIGPPGAEVEDVKVMYEDYKSEYMTFSIVY